MSRTFLLPVIAGCILIAASVQPRAAQPTSANATVGQQADSKKWDVTADLGPTQRVAFDTSEGTWMNLDVSPDGQNVDLRPARRHLPDAGGRNRGLSGDPPHERSRLRHAASLQPRRQAHRVFERPRRALEHLDDGRRGKEREAGVAREALVHQQPGVGARRELHLCAPPLRRLPLARRRRDLDVPCRRVRRPAGHREERLPEGRRRAGHFPGRPLPVLTARTSRPGSCSNTTRTPTARSTRSSAAT